MRGSRKIAWLRSYAEQPSYVQTRNLCQPAHTRKHDDGYEQFLKGEFTPTVALRVSARFLSVHPEFVWLNRLQCLAVGEFDSENSWAG